MSAVAGRCCEEDAPSAWRYMKLQPGGHTNILRLDIDWAAAYIGVTCQAWVMILSSFSDIDVRVEGLESRDR